MIFRDGMVAGARPDFAWGKRRQVSPCNHKREGDIKQRLPEVLLLATYLLLSTFLHFHKGVLGAAMWIYRSMAEVAYNI